VEALIFVLPGAPAALRVYANPSIFARIVRTRNSMAKIGTAITV